jgi:prephenate dehydrogenase
VRAARIHPNGRVVAEVPNGSSAACDRVVVVGGAGEFGRFLRYEVLPRLGATSIACIERSTPAAERISLLRRARHVLLATPLAGYPEGAVDLVRECHPAPAPVTLWLIPSVQLPTAEAVSRVHERLGDPCISVVLFHPMYGPASHASPERRARGPQNILTATMEGGAYPLEREIESVGGACERVLGITTTRAFDPREHDRITASSQGLSYCLAMSMFDEPELDAEVRQRLPELHRSFHTDRELIGEFMRANSFAPAVRSAFEASRDLTGSRGLEGALRAFREVDRELNGPGSAIPTTWYERLRDVSARPTG